MLLIFLPSPFANFKNTLLQIYIVLMVISSYNMRHSNDVLNNFSKNVPFHFPLLSEYDAEERFSELGVSFYHFGIYQREFSDQAEHSDTERKKPAGR